MTTQIALMFLWAVTVGLAVTLYFYRRRKQSESPDQDRKAAVDKALSELNAKCKWTRDKDNVSGSFTYQGSSFRVQLAPKSPYVSLSLLFIDEAELDQIDTVRACVNESNLVLGTAHVIYTLDGSHNKVHVHVLADISLPDDDKAGHQMAVCLGNMFALSKYFVRKFTGATTEARHTGIDDSEHNDALRERKAFLISEQEMAHQLAGNLWRSGVDSAVTVGSLLAGVMQLHDIVPVALRTAIYTADGGCSDSVNDDTDKILLTDIAGLLISGGKFTASSAVLTLSYYDPAAPKQERWVCLMVTRGEQTADTLYYRVSIMRQPLQADAHVLTDRSQPPLSVSLLAACDLADPSQRKAEFEYQWKEAMAAQAKGDTDGLSDEQKLLLACHTPDVAAIAWRGMTLYGRHRFYEAIEPLREVYSAMIFWNFHRSNNDRERVDQYYELCYVLGFCYTALGLYAEGYYYLEQTLPSQRIDYTEEYINCLVDGRDPRAVEIINGLLFDLQAFDGVGLNDDGEEDEAFPSDGQSEPDDEAQHAFYDFLRRRKASALINDHRYDQAEQLLKTLLDEPANSVFAQRELAYMSRARGAGNKDNSTHRKKTQ